MNTLNNDYTFEQMANIKRNLINLSKKENNNADYVVADTANLSNVKKVLIFDWKIKNDAVLINKENKSIQLLRIRGNKGHVKLSQKLADKSDFYNIIKSEVLKCN